MKLAILCLALANLAMFSAGQSSTDSLRAKYGTPLNRETFVVRPGLEMVVDYSLSGHICRLRFPASHNIVGEATAGIVTTKMVEEALEEVVPPAMRGKETGGRGVSAGSLAVLVTEYEHVTISELQNANSAALHGEITVTFKGETCRDEAIRK